MTIRRKLTLWYSGLVMIIIVIFAVAMYGVTSFLLFNSIDTALNETVDQVWSNSYASPIAEFGSPRSILVQIPELDVLRASGVVVQVWNMSGSEPQLAGSSSNIRGYRSPLDPQALATSATLPLMPNQRALNYTNSNLTVSEWRVLTQSIDVWGNRIVIQTGTSLETVNESLDKLVLILIGSMAVALIISMLLGFNLSNRALKPINNITHAASQIAAADDLTTRLAWTGPMDELGRLTSVFNQMMERLQDLFRVQQRFVADVSHELRTPLTAIQGNLELIHRYGMDPESLEAIDAETKRMSRMVSDLLVLARADYGGIQFEFQPISLNTLLNEVRRESEVLVHSRELTFILGNNPDIEIIGDYDRMKQLLLNLVSNAIKFTRNGGTITVQSRQEDGRAIIEVIDTGIGISSEDAKHIFDRFFQADTSRVRAENINDGVGLGLSIAKWIAQSHHGKIFVESRLGEGSTFRVSIPLNNTSNTYVSPYQRQGRFTRLWRHQPVDKP